MFRNMSTKVADALISAEWLARNLSRPDLLILDIRSAATGPADAYARAHIPGAVHSDYVNDGWRVSHGMAQGLLPSAAQLASLFARLGITPDKHVIIVSAGAGPGDFSMAARVYWTLKVAGHRRLSVVDGGMGEWLRDGARPLEHGEPSVAPAPPYPIALDAALRSDLAAVEQVVAHGGAVLLDSRARRFFEGSDKSASVARAGRLPHARLVDYTAAFNGARLKSRDELEQLFAALPDAPIVNYCNTGQQAAANWFVLSELLGRPRVSLYDGSMSQWAENQARPVITGP